jgi:hypothetical protein
VNAPASGSAPAPASAAPKHVPTVTALKREPEGATRPAHVESFQAPEAAVAARVGKVESQRAEPRQAVPVEARGSARERNNEARGSAREQSNEARGSAREQNNAQTARHRGVVAASASRTASAHKSAPAPVVKRALGRQAALAPVQAKSQRGVARAVDSESANTESRARTVKASANEQAAPKLLPEKSPADKPKASTSLAERLLAKPAEKSAERKVAPTRGDESLDELMDNVVKHKRGGGNAGVGAGDDPIFGL